MTAKINLSLSALEPLPDLETDATHDIANILAYSQAVSAKRQADALERFVDRYEKMNPLHTSGPRK